MAAQSKEESAKSKPKDAKPRTYSHGALVMAMKLRDNLKPYIG